MTTEVLKTKGDQQINIKACASCRKPHMDLPIMSYKEENAAPYSHWYICPETGDPVSTLFMMRGEKVVEAKRAILNALVEAENAGSFMIAVFANDKGTTKLFRMTHEFPTEQFNNCVDALKENLDNEVGPPQEVELVTAKPEGPSINVFSDE